MFRHGASLFPTTYGLYAGFIPVPRHSLLSAARLSGAPNHLAKILPTALASAGWSPIYCLLVAVQPAAHALTLLTTQLTASKSRARRA
jgi:hypothetical protein